MNTKLKRLSNDGRIVYAALMEAFNGDRRARRALRDVATGMGALTESITTSDFPGLFQQAINAQVEPKYTETPSIWQNWASAYGMKGLRKENMIDLMADFDNLPAENGGVATLPGGLPRIPEGTPFPAIAFTGGEKEVWTYKLGARLAFTWEAWDQDDWGMIAQLPTALAARARRTEDLSATSVLVDSSGPKTSVFGTLGTAKLSYTSLDAAIAQASQSVDPDRVNVINKWALIVPRALTRTAHAVVNTTQIETTGTDGSKLVVNNTIGTQVEVVENPFLSLFYGNYANKDTAWMLVPWQGQGSDRKAIVQTFINGKEQPELRIKIDQGMLLGGGQLDPYAGSFDTDDTQIRVRHFTNTVVTDSTLGFYASSGTV